MPARAPLPTDAPPPPPSGGARGALSERLLFARLRAGTDPCAREQVIRHFLPLADSLAVRFVCAGEPLEDLKQVAYAGLVKAVDRFDPDRGVAFSSFAVPTILGEIRRYFRDHGWAVRPPRRLQERAVRVRTFDEQLTAALGRAPSLAELARESGCSEEGVLEARVAYSTYGALSLDYSREDGEDALDPPGHRLASVDSSLQQAFDRVFLGQVERLLPVREREILRLRFEEDLTQSEIARRMGITQMHVSRLLRRAIGTLSCQVVASPN